MSTKEKLVNLMGSEGEVFRNNHSKAFEKLSNSIAEDLVSRCINQCEVDAIFGRGSNSYNYDVSVVDYINNDDEIKNNLILVEIDFHKLSGNVTSKIKKTLETAPHDLKVSNIQLDSSEGALRDFNRGNFYIVIGLKWKGMF